MNDVEFLRPDLMFRGKYLPGFLQHYAPLFRYLVGLHGREKVDKVYDYFYRFVCGLQWGQWMVLDRVCPQQEMRQLFYWVMECIYESDLCSLMRFEEHMTQEAREVRIVIVAPTDEQQRLWAPFLGQRRYLFIDWYGRLRDAPGCNPDINPEWLMLEAQPNEWGGADNDARPGEFSLDD